MKCSGCQEEATRIIAYENLEVCENCADIRASGGTKRDGIMSRQSQRVRSESSKFEVDTLPPHRYDKGSRKWVANEDFINNNPENVHNFLDDEELKCAGCEKLAKGKNGNKKD